MTYVWARSTIFPENQQKMGSAFATVVLPSADWFTMNKQKHAVGLVETSTKGRFGRPWPGNSQEKPSQMVSLWNGSGGKPADMKRFGGGHLSFLGGGFKNVKPQTAHRPTQAQICIHLAGSSPKPTEGYPMFFVVVQIKTFNGPETWQTMLNKLAPQRC